MTMHDCVNGVRNLTPHSYAIPRCEQSCYVTWLPCHQFTGEGADPPTGKWPP